jgi:hypothetical protein
LNCKHHWQGEVVYSQHTQMLTGEVTPPCLVCGSKTIMSGPIHEFVIMECAAKAVARALRNIGMHDAYGDDPEVNFTGGSEEGYDFVIRIGKGPGRLEFRIAEETRPVEVKTIAGGHMEVQTLWVAHAEVMCDGGRDDPPYSDEIEVAEGGSPENVLIEALLVYFRNTMYDSMPYIERNLDEDIPQ